MPVQVLEPRHQPPEGPVGHGENALGAQVAQDRHQLALEQGSQGLHMQEEGLRDRFEGRAVWREAAGRDQDVDVNVVGELARPGVQNQGQPEGGAQARLPHF